MTFPNMNYIMMFAIMCTYFFRCDRILSHGNGMRLLSYKRNELKLSDHRPVTATFIAEVEVFSPRKLQRALTFTDAEIENEEVITNLGAWNLAA